MSKFPLFIPLSILLAVSIFGIVQKYFCQANCVLGVSETTPLKRSVLEITPVPYPNLVGKEIPPSISAQSAVVMDLDSKKVLFAKNERIRFSPASTVKIMTALLSVETYALLEQLTVEEKITDGSTMGLVQGEEVSVESLLYGLLLNSGNDAAFVLAKNFPTGGKMFIKSMNKKARELQLSDTIYADPAGLDDDGNFTTSLDMATLASEAIKNPTLAKIFATKEKTVFDKTGKISHKLQNLNKLLGSLDGANGVKTGTTLGAGEVLVASAKRDGHTLITVVMKSEDRFADTTRLTEWAFANYQFVSVLDLSTTLQ